jgi:His-Xaa-Ser system radical SAM maturase HxsC
MIPLHAYGVAQGVSDAVLGRVTFADVATELRRDYIRAVVNTAEHDLSGYVGALAAAPIQAELPTVHTVALEHLHSGDVVCFDRRGHVRTLYRRSSAHNFLFATERCNSYCLMCSQPPKHVDDQWRVNEHLRVIELIDADAQSLGITGGEPTLLKDGLIDIVAKCKERLPDMALHILSNGRLFCYDSFARKIGEVRHTGLMIGVPLYADADAAHDHIVQAKGAFDQTLIGLQNLARHGVPVEIRIVVHALTWRRLEAIAEFVYRNLTFAAHVTFMGLEPMGFAVPNFEALWIDPWDYRDELTAATLFLARRGVSVSVYNHQLCTVPQTIWSFCRQSISDWKSEYLPVCETCDMRSQCGGFFMSSAKRRWSAHVTPVHHTQRFDIDGPTMPKSN